MKKIACLLLSVLLLSVGALAVDESRGYEYELSVNGKQEIEAEPGDIITVTAYLRRTDSAKPADIYAIQDEIHYDGSLLEVVEGGEILASGVQTTDIAITGTERAFYITFASFGGGTTWEAEKLLGSFQMRVLGDTGTAELTQENYLVSNSNGTDSFAVDAKNVTVKLPNAGPEQTEETESPSVVPEKTEGLSRNGMILAAILIGAGLIILLLILLLVGKRKKKNAYQGSHSKH